MGFAAFIIGGATLKSSRKGTMFPSLMHSAIWQTDLGSIVNQGEQPPIMLDQDITAPISRLLRHCRPVAVVRRVWAVVITPFDLMFRRWHRPHIRHKHFKIVPRITDQDSDRHNDHKQGYLDSGNETASTSNGCAH